MHSILLVESQIAKEAEKPDVWFPRNWFVTALDMEASSHFAAIVRSYSDENKTHEASTTSG